MFISELPHTSHQLPRPIGWGPALGLQPPFPHMLGDREPTWIFLLTSAEPGRSNLLHHGQRQPPGEWANVSWAVPRLESGQAGNRQSAAKTCPGFRENRMSLLAGNCLGRDLNLFTLVPRRKEEKPIKYGVWLLGTPGCVVKAWTGLCALYPGKDSSLALPGQLCCLRIRFNLD